MFKWIFDALKRVWDWIKKTFVRFFNFLRNLAGFFKGNYQEVKRKYPRAKPIALKIEKGLKSGDFSEMSLADLGIDGNVVVVNTYYDETTGDVLEDYTEVVGTDHLDQQTINAFGDKDMLVLKNE